MKTLKAVVMLRVQLGYFWNFVYQQEPKEVSCSISVLWVKICKNVHNMTINQKQNTNVFMLTIVYWSITFPKHTHSIFKYRNAVQCMTKPVLSFSFSLFLTKATACMLPTVRWFEEKDASDSDCFYTKHITTNCRIVSGCRFTIPPSPPPFCFVFLPVASAEVDEGEQHAACQCIMRPTVIGGLNVHISLTLDMLSVLLLTIIN